MVDFSEFGLREKDGWSDGDIVESYVNHFVPVTDRVGHHIVENHISSNDRVLDLCCGQGTLTAAISNVATMVAGLDFSQDMIARAQTAAPNAEIMEGDAMAMPYQDASFDKVVCNFGMMHIPDQPKALSEIRRVLKPDGQFIMATWMSPPGSAAFAAVFGALKAHADFSVAPPQPDLFTFTDPDQAKTLMDSARLDMTEHNIIEANWTFEKPGELFDIFVTATVGAGMLIRSQSDETVKKIAETVTKTVRDKHYTGTNYVVPVTVAVIAARAV